MLSLMETLLVMTVALAVMTAAAPASSSSTTTTGTVQNQINMTAPGGQPLSELSQALRLRSGGNSVTEAVIDLISNACIFDEDNLFLRNLAFVATQDGTSASTYGTPGYYGGIWQVDENMFRSTQANTPALAAKHAAIYDAFGIDWMSVQWQDLERPLYSGLAAALYIVTQGTVPVNQESQGSFAHSHYHSWITAFNYTTRIHHLPVCDSSSPVQFIDIAFLLDSTTSHDNFLRMRDFVRDVVDSPLSVGADPRGNIRVALYQFGSNQHGQPDIVKNVDMTAFTDQQQLVKMVSGLTQADVAHHNTLNIGQAVSAVIHDTFTADNRPLSAKMVVLLTDSNSTDHASMLAAQQDATRNGVSIMALGVGPNSDPAYLDQMATKPQCRHHLAVNDFRDLKYYVQLVQRTICNEPMIAQGMVHCNIEDCRNVAFPLTSTATTLVTNVTCDDGRVFVTTRMPRPGRGFKDFSSYVDNSSGPTYVTVYDSIGSFLYADFFPSGQTAKDCVATLWTVNGIVGQQTEEKCRGNQYPNHNPCKTPGRTKIRFPYPMDQGYFIQCDFLDKMYLTKCPPEDPYYSPECEMCVGGPNSPVVATCGSHPSANVTSPYCGLPVNPCTSDNIQQGHFYFACPVDETTYLQCNVWGHAYVRSCPEHQVWREKSLTCEYIDTLNNPCGTPGVRYYPYPPDPHYFIDCGADMVPVIKHCTGNLVWNEHVDTCDYPHKTTRTYVLTNPTGRVTLPTTATGSPGGVPVTPDPSSGLLSQNFAPPCTQERVAAMELFWPYPNHPAQYIQCDLWGDAFVRNCQPGFTYDETAHTCVNGNVHVSG